MELNHIVPSYLSSNVSDLQINMKIIRNNHHLSKCEEFKSLVDVEAYCDVTFICKGGEKVFCHSTILASVSPMLKEWMKEHYFKSEKYNIVIPEISGECMKYFVQLLYGNTLVLNLMDQYYLLESLCQQLNIESKILNQGDFIPRSLGRKERKKKSSSPLPLCCWRCGASFSQLAQLKHHVAEKHFGEKIKATKRHRCTKCKKVLPSMWKLRQHLLTHTINNANVDHQYAEPRKSRNHSRRSIDHPYANPPPATSSDHPYSSRTDSSKGSNCGIPTTNNGTGNNKRKNISHSLRSKSSSKRSTNIDSLHSYASSKSALSPDQKYEQVEEMIVLDDVLPSSPPPLMDTKALEPPITSSASATSQFTCEMCHKSFPQKYRLTRHVEEVHEQVKNFICPFQGCSKAFFKKTSITRHSLTHLKDSIYHCENCWKKFKDPSGLKYHVAKGVCTKKDSSNKN